MLPNGKALTLGMGMGRQKGCIMEGKGIGGWGKGSVVGQGIRNAGVGGGNGGSAIGGVNMGVLGRHMPGMHANTGRGPGRKMPETLQKRYQTWKELYKMKGFY